MASRTFFLQLIVLGLCFSHLIISSNAVPVTRIGSLKHGNYQVHDLPQETTHQKVSTEKVWDIEKIVAERIDVELHDYPGSGANNRHTPKPPLGRCADC